MALAKIDARQRPREPLADRLPSRCLKVPNPPSTRTDGGCVHTRFRDDIDGAADRAVAVEHRTGVAPRDLDPLDAIARNGGKIDAGEIDVGQPPPVDQHERIGCRRRRRSRVYRPWCRRRSRPPKILHVWTPGTRAMIACSDSPGERAMSSAVMIVVEAPMMPWIETARRDVDGRQDVAAFLCLGTRRDQIRSTRTQQKTHDMYAISIATHSFACAHDKCTHWVDHPDAKET